MRQHMPSPTDKPIVRIAPNNQVFDLPVIVAIEEGLFARAGLDVRVFDVSRGALDIGREGVRHLGRRRLRVKQPLHRQGQLLDQLVPGLAPRLLGALVRGLRLILLPALAALRHRHTPSPYSRARLAPSAALLREASCQCVPPDAVW